jgi:HAD superfamily hydrolase (TIGR01509 family)
VSRPDGLRAVLFDLDGTLVASHEALWKAYAAFLSAHGCQPTREEFVSLDGPSIPQIVRWLRDAHDLGSSPAELETEYRAFLDKGYRDAPAGNGADEALEALSARLSLALVTSAPSSLVVELLRTRGWLGKFGAVVTGDEGASKPEPDLYELALGRLGVGADEAVAVEDGQHGVEAAVAAGIYTVGIASTPARAEALRGAGAAEVVPDLRQLAGTIL